MNTTEVVSGRTLSFLSASCEDYSLFVMFWYTPLGMWSPVGRNQLYWTDRDTLLDHECGRPGVFVQRLKICQGKKRSELFACRTSRKRGAVGSYYWSLAYGVLAKFLHMTKRCGGVYMNVTAESSWRWAREQSEVFTTKKGQKHFIWVVLALFRAIRYISHPRYLLDDGDSRECRRLRSKALTVRE